MKKKLLCILLSTAMMFTAVDSLALAAERPTEPQTAVEETQGETDADTKLQAEYHSIDAIREFLNCHLCGTTEFDSALSCRRVVRFHIRIGSCHDSSNSFYSRFVL